MKKVRVLKEMPFAKVGEEFESHPGETLGMKGIGFSISMNAMVLAGWLEWVEEPKTLEEKFCEQNHCGGMECNCTGLAQIAKDHYLEAFDKTNNFDTLEPISDVRITFIRKALEDA